MLLYNWFLVYIKDDLPHWLESVTSHSHTRSNWLGPVTSSCHTTTQLIRDNHFQQAIIRQISLVFQFYFIYMWFLLLHITFKKIYPMPSLTWHYISFFFARNDSGVFVLQLLLAYNGKTHFHFTQVTYMLPFFVFQISPICIFFATSQVEMSQGYPHIFSFFFGYVGTFIAIAWIINILSVCPRERTDYARNKADC